MTSARIGVFGGSFDPPHAGHLIVAQDAWSALELDVVLWVPAARPPHKREGEISPADVRLEMVRAALGDDPRFRLCGLELERGGPSYTVDTLEELARDHPAGELFLLLGADQFREFHAWRDPDGILGRATLVVLTREGIPLEGPSRALAHRRLDVTRVDISATDIRGRVGGGRSIRYLVPEAVERIIRREKLYLETGTGGAARE